MSRKRFRWLIAVLLIIGIALVSFWWFYLRPPYGVTFRSYSKIQKGMTLEEVETIIGSKRSGGLLTPRILGVTFGEKHLFDGPPDAGLRNWWGERWFGPSTMITVYIDWDGLVVAKGYDGPKAPNFLSRLLEMLGL
jgi:hypothetical protein